MPILLFLFLQLFACERTTIPVSGPMATTLEGCSLLLEDVFCGPADTGADASECTTTRAGWAGGNAYGSFVIPPDVTVSDEAVFAIEYYKTDGPEYTEKTFAWYIGLQGTFGPLSETEFTHWPGHRAILCDDGAFAFVRETVHDNDGDGEGTYMASTCIYGYFLEDYTGTNMLFPTTNTDFTSDPGILGFVGVIARCDGLRADDEELTNPSSIADVHTIMRDYSEQSIEVNLVRQK